jgi:hypothetical protein
MIQERLTVLEHAAVARMDTREWLLQKANVLHELYRLVQGFKSGLQYSSMLHQLEMDTREWLVQKANVLQ